MNVRFLETFVWLVRLRSFSKTAEMLNATQPAVSNRIGKLELLLNVQLYDHNSRQFVLTPAGRRILRYAEQIVSATASLREVAVEDEHIADEIRIGVLETVTISWLPLLLERLSANFPKASFRISTGTTQTLIEQLRSDKVDLIFAVGPVDLPNIIFSPICRVKISWLCHAAKYALIGDIDVVELSRFPLVFPLPGSSGYDQVVEYFASHGIVDIPPRNRQMMLECVYSMGTAMHVVKSGMGIMAMPEFAFRKDIEAGIIRVLNVRQTFPDFCITAGVKHPAPNEVMNKIIGLSKDAALEYVTSTKETAITVD